jgi:hypothetical protein
VGFPETEPFVELFPGNVIKLAVLLDGMKPGEMHAQNLKDKQQTVSGIRDDDIGKNGMGATAALTADPENA